MWSTGMRIFLALASTSPTSMPPSCVKRIQSPCASRRQPQTPRPSFSPWRLVAHLTDGVDVNVVLRPLRMRHKRLDQKLPQHARDRLHLLRLARLLRHPGAGLGPGLVEGEQAALAAALDQLVGLGHELGPGGQQPGVGGLGLVEHGLRRLVLGEVERGELGGRVVRGGGREGARLDDGGAGQVVVEDGLAVGLEDGLGGHGGGWSGGAVAVVMAGRRGESLVGVSGDPGSRKDNGGESGAQWHGKGGKVLTAAYGKLRGVAVTE